MASIRRRAKSSDVNKQLSGWSKRRIASWSLFGLAALVAGQHLVGYPMAIALAVVGGIVMDPNPRI